MKKYMTPDLKVMAFMAEEEISTVVTPTEQANVEGSNHYNDVELKW